MNRSCFLNFQPVLWIFVLNMLWCICPFVSPVCFSYICVYINPNICYEIFYSDLTGELKNTKFWKNIILNWYIVKFYNLLSNSHTYFIKSTKKPKKNIYWISVINLWLLTFPTPIPHKNLHTPSIMYIYLH